jgi:hypothetical protein
MTTEKPTAETMWEHLKEFEHVEADGYFTCKHTDGRRVILLYSAERKIFLTCNYEEELCFEENH